MTWQKCSIKRNEMKLDEILLLTDVNEIYKNLAYVNPYIKITYLECDKQFDPLKHGVMDEVERPMKQVQKPTGQVQGNGEPQYATSLQDVSRLAVPFQKIIVSRVAAFLLNNGIIRHNDAETPGEINVISMIDQIWKDNKLDYRTKQMARMLFSECEVAELWYYTKEENLWTKFLSFLKLTKVMLRPRMRILANSLGDKLYPHFDESGDMDAFAREYSILVDQKLIMKLELYTADKIFHYTNLEGIWTSDQGYPQANPLGKIPVVYYYQPYPEWYDVQELIERFETLISNFADSNDYFGSPMIKVKGKVMGFADKGEQGKILQLEGDADATYMTWDQAPESIKIELENLQALIYSMTQTPNISFDNLKSIGTVSGVALKLIFMDMHLKCFAKQEVFGEMIQRRFNLLKAIVGKVIATKLDQDAENVELWPEFIQYLPSVDGELVSNLSVAVAGKAIMSQETAVKKNPFVDDPEKEMEQIGKENVVDISQPTI